MTSIIRSVVAWALVFALLMSLLTSTIPASAAEPESQNASESGEELQLEDIVDDPDATPFVFGGEPVSNPGWVASVIVDGFYSCTGSLIQPQWVLTAAHCADNASSTYEVRVGDSRWFAGHERGVVARAIHPAWDPAALTTVDLALLKLSSPITGAPLPDLSGTATWPVIGQQIVVVGWGETFRGSSVPDYLQGASVTVNSDHTGVPASSTFCNPAWVAASGYEDFCFGTAVAWACPGDSGGPLVGRATPTTSSGPINTIYGVTSFGGEDGCSSFYEPVGQSVGPHISWINSVVNPAGTPGPGDEMFFYREDGLYRYYDVASAGSVGKPILAGDNYTKGWSTIIGIDLEGDGQDEMFFYREDGLYRFYNVRSDGSLGQPIQAGAGFTKNWNSIAAVDLDGDGQDEIFFYREDGLYRYYDIRSNGTIGSPLRAGDDYTTGWSSITSIDLEGDGQDEMFFYREDGLYRYYDIRSNGTIGSPLQAGDNYTNDWTTITAIDLDGDRQDEIFFYREDGLYRYYDIRSNGTIGVPIRAGDNYTKGWTAIAAVNLGD